MTSIQAVYIRGHEDRAQPKPHVVYRIEVQAGVRSWQMWRRYSEFTDLHTELAKTAGAPPPAPLPPKHALGSFFKSRDDARLVEERRAGLEAYLRAIVGAKDERWRDTFAFRDFLGVPVGKPGAANSGSGGFTSSAWLDEHGDVQARIRDIRADVNRRDAFSSGNDVGGAHTANVQAKKKLAGVLSAIGALDRGLDELALGGMAEGELQRRRDMAARLRDDCETLAKVVTTARHTTTGAGVAASGSADTDRQALLQNGSGFAVKPGRVFGAPKPVETEETRPLDDQGLLQLQQQKMEQQDQDLDSLATILRRQKQLGIAIHSEVSQQIEIIDDLNNEVDRVGGNLGKAKKQLNRLG
jgi:regulator of vacuolar morphogenesis